jgi:hypothetical protein
VLLRITLASAVLFCAGLAIDSAIAGFAEVGARFDDIDPKWLPVALAAQAVAFVGYVFAYRGVARVDDGPQLGIRESAEYVAVGFGAFLAKGGAALDNKVFDSSTSAGETRTIALDALEHAPLAPAACIAAWVLLGHGSRTPGLDFTLPWATLVPIGALVAIWGVRHRSRFVDADGWRGRLGQVLDGIHILFRIVAEWRIRWPALVGSLVYWAGDVFCLWASARAFGAQPTAAAVILAHAVAYVLTRRTLPLAGAGVVELLLPLTLAASGSPFSGAIAATLVYRIFNLWLPLLPAAVGLRHLKRWRAHGARPQSTRPA